MKESSINKPRKNTLTWIIFILLGFLMVSNTYLLIDKSKDDYKPKEDYRVLNSDKKIEEIKNYLDSISPSYIEDVKALAKERGIPSWGCGPSSYALALIINKKFFDNNLVIDASYNNNNPYEIIERFSIAQSGEKIVDHAWLEIYFNDKFLFIDPTIGQFGKINKISYRVFNVGQSNISDILKKDYGIEDVRLSLLLQKVINRIPVYQDPYPGMTIGEESVGYFLKVLEDRNNVNDGIEPPEWKDWVNHLTSKYLN